MNFLIAESFTASFNRLSGLDQKAVKASVFDLQMDPTGNGLQLHRIDKSKDQNFWSARVNRDIRLIIHKTSESVLVAYVGHHDDAYGWAERRRIEAHPRTGAIQIVEVRELVEESVPARPKEKPAPALFARLDDNALLSIGVPPDWLADVRIASEEGFFALAQHLPAEAAEALLEYATTGRLAPPAPKPAIADPFAHPDALRRIRPIADQQELEQALAFPWEKWGVFLHPSQRALVERTFSGPTRVAGSAGTGKTIVAIHRAVKLARENASARILLASFSQPLADAMAKKLLVLAPETGGIVQRITTASFHGIAEQMYQLEHGVRPRIASETVLRERLRTAAANLKGFSERFLLSEWTNVIDAWGLTSLDAYATVQRMGRKSRLGPNQRASLWPAFEAVREALAVERYTTWANVFTDLANALAQRPLKPFDHVVIDEAQDLAPAELRFFAALAPAKADGLFLSGDVGQRIFQHPYSWASLGVDVRGRSHTLKVCYRTSQQIRRAADRLLPAVLRDTDGLEDERRGIVSVFEGPAPEVKSLASAEIEAEIVRKTVKTWLEEGIAPREIGLFVRTTQLVARARAAIAGLAGVDEMVTVPMSSAKGLEFRAIIVMACDQGVLPLDERVADAADEAELDDIYETERRLLYVACTRAREHLLLTGVTPTSEYLADFLQ
ncbi:AAA family ATPase [Acidiphilium sp. AL]|uniref:DNA 3'-5' helicase n=1 Tax=Acidiphilium iwatense TaxID=768198 RepID=A0ABS9E085_9PROT|nr:MULTISPECIES: UvrD-helicase domain-containing protein [Acidiphilium]MCF3948420.1 AAA family ATPase [Acidiphilium iwatense]MCU4161653.1 AAA family ATPase [Acidiphilium sp. AL]